MRKVKEEPVGTLPLESNPDLARQPHRRSSAEEGDRLVLSSIRSKREVQDVMQSLAKPANLGRLLFVSIIICMSTMAMALAQHIIFVQLSEQVTYDVRMFDYEAEQHRLLTDASSVILQAVAVNE